MFATGSQVAAGCWSRCAAHGVRTPSTQWAGNTCTHWTDDLRRAQIRAVAFVRICGPRPRAVRIFACAARRPGKGSAPLWRRDVGSWPTLAGPDELRVDKPPEAVGAWCRTRDPRWHERRHDQCCANLGRPLVRALRDSRWAVAVGVLAIGGDRFAPHVVVLPDSLYFVA